MIIFTGNQYIWYSQIGNLSNDGYKLGYNLSTCSLDPPSVLARLVKFIKYHQKAIMKSKIIAIVFIIINITTKCQSVYSRNFSKYSAKNIMKNKSSLSSSSMSAQSANLSTLASPTQASIYLCTVDSGPYNTTNILPPKVSATLNFSSRGSLLQKMSLNWLQSFRPVKDED